MTLKQEEMMDEAEIQEVLRSAREVNMQRALRDWTRFAKPARTAEALYKATEAASAAEENPNLTQSAKEKMHAKAGKARDLHHIEMERFLK